MNINLPNSVLYPSLPKQQSGIKHRVGNVYLAISEHNTREYYVLANVAFGCVTLICISNNDANRWVEPVKVKDMRNTSQKEIGKILGLLKQAKFTYIGRLEDVLKIIPSRRSEDILTARIFGEEE